MTRPRPRFHSGITACLSLAASFSLTLVLVGCGGGGGESGDAVTYTEPGATVKTPTATSTSSGGGTPSADTGKTAAADSSKSAAPVKAEGWGTLKGQVIFGGNPPPVEELIAKGAAPKDPTYCAKDAPIPAERLVVDAASKGVKSVLVYIPKPTAVNEEAKSTASKATVEFDQKKCIFNPHVLGLMLGATVELKSSDEVNHNVNARLKAGSSMNSSIAAGNKLPFTPTAAERTPGEVICDIHNWMKAYWMVLDNPYFAVTDAQGNFEIKNVPAGTQKVVVWQEAASFVTPTTGEDVTITANDATSKTFTIDPGKIKPAR